MNINLQEKNIESILEHKVIKYDNLIPRILYLIYLQLKDGIKFRYDYPNTGPR